MGDEEGRREEVGEACHLHEVFLGSKKSNFKVVATTDNMGDEERRQVEAGDACHHQEILLGGMKTCSKDAATTEEVVVQDRQGEVGEPTTFKRTYYLETTT